VFKGCFDGLTVFITVSALAKSKNGVLQDRLIEINWNHADLEAHDWVGLFDHPPEQGISDPLEAVNVTISRGIVSINKNS
jgi:hypothetical protein